MDIFVIKSKVTMSERKLGHRNSIISQVSQDYLGPNFSAGHCLRKLSEVLVYHANVLKELAMQ